MIRFNWVIGPVVTGIDGVRRPLVATLADPGRIGWRDDDPQSADFGKTFNAPILHSSVYRGDQALSIVAGVDLSNMIGHPSLRILFEDDYAQQPGDILRSPAVLSWDVAKHARLRTRLQSEDADLNGLDDESPLCRLIDRVGRRFDPAFDATLLKPGVRARV